MSGRIHSQANYANYYIKEKFPSAPPIDKIVQNIEFIMVNSNEFVDYPRLLPPNVLQVGGLQMREPKPLPEVQIKDTNRKIGTTFFIDYCV